MGISSEEEEEQVKFETERSFEGENTQDPKRDAGEQQMNGTLYFMKF